MDNKILANLAIYRIPQDFVPRKFCIIRYLKESKIHEDAIHTAMYQQNKVKCVSLGNLHIYLIVHK